MGRKKMDRKKRKKICIFFGVIGIISTLVAIIFCLALFVLNMVPVKYLITIYIILFILYAILLYLIFQFKIKISVKTLCIVFFVIFDIIFGFGIKYISKTINFVDIIDNKLHQKEEYYIMTLSGYNDIKEIENDYKTQMNLLK